MTAKQAFDHWKSFRPFEGHPCCSGTHDTDPSFYGDTPRPDASVCDRERAWREYVRIRDANPNFPFGKKYDL